MDVAPRPAEKAGAHGLGRGSGEAGRGEGEAALEIVRAVLEQERRADRLVANLADALVGALLERDVEERDDAQALRPVAGVAQRQDADVARPVGRDEHDCFHRQVAARLRECRDARLVSDPVLGVRALEGREDGRVRLARVEVAQIDDLPRLHHRRAVEAEGGQAVLAGVGEGGEDLAVVRHHRRHAELVRHHVRPGTRRAGSQIEPPAVLRKRERPAVRQGGRRLDRAGLVDARVSRSGSEIGGRPRRRATSSLAQTALSERPMTNSASTEPLADSVISTVKLAAGSKVQSLPSSSSFRHRQGSQPVGFASEPSPRKRVRESS